MRRLFEGGAYSGAALIRVNTVINGYLIDLIDLALFSSELATRLSPGLLLSPPIRTPALIWLWQCACLPSK